MRIDLRPVHVLLAGALLASPLLPANGQTTEVVEPGIDQPEAGVSERYVCLSRAKTHGQNVRADANRKPTRIVVSESLVPGLARKGFQVIDCTLAKLDTTSSREAWRDEICARAAFGNESIQNQYARIYGERPAALCSAAQRVSGKFDRKKLKPPKASSDEGK